MANSYVEYPTSGTGTNELGQKVFAIPFKYIAIADVEVKGYNGSTWTDLTIAATDNTAKNVELSAAPSTYQKIRVWRNTGTTQLVDFQNGSRLSESDLDTAYQQGLYVAQEVSENASATGYPATGAEGVSISSVTSSTTTGGNILTFIGSDGVTKGTVNVTDGTDGTDPFDSSGNLIVASGSVGIGTSSPSTYNGQLVNYKATGSGTFLGHTNAGGSFPKVSAIGMGSDAVSLTHTSNGATFALTGSVQIAAEETAASGAPTDLVFYTNASGTVTERMRIKGDGTVIINNIPTSSTNLTSGAIYSDGGTLKIV